MAKGGSFLGSVAKSVLIGLAASYAIKYIQNKMHAHQDDELGEDGAAKAGKAKAE